MIVNLALIALLVGMGVVYLIEIRQARQFLRRLEAAHPETWEILRKPGFFDKDRRLGRIEFVLGRKYANLNDPLLTKLGDCVRALDIVVLVLLMVFFTILLVQRAQ